MCSLMEMDGGQVAKGKVKKLWEDERLLGEVVEGGGDRFLGLFLRGCLELGEGHNALLGL